MREGPSHYASRKQEYSSSSSSRDIQHGRHCRAMESSDSRQAALVTRSLARHPMHTTRLLHLTLPA